MKTREEIETLKRQWLADGCWDIEETEGFEDHKEELLKFRLDTEAAWKANEKARIENKAFELGIKVEMVDYIEKLEYQIKRLSERIEKLENPEPDAGMWGEYQHFKKTHGGG